MFYSKERKDRERRHSDNLADILKSKNGSKEELHSHAMYHQNEQTFTKIIKKQIKKEDLGRQMSSFSFYNNDPIVGYHDNNLTPKRQEDLERDMGEVYGVEDLRPEIWNCIPRIKPQ